MSKQLQVKLINLNENASDFVKLVLRIKKIDYVIVKTFTEPGLSFGTDSEQPIIDTVFGCAYVHLSENLLTVATTVEVMLEMIHNVQNKTFIGKTCFTNIEKAINELYAKEIWPIFDPKIELAKKMILDTREIHPKLRLEYSIAAQRVDETLASEEFLIEIIKNMLEDKKESIKKSDIFRWNTGFGVISINYPTRTITKLTILNILCNA
jgi:hypothetical protein